MTLERPSLSFDVKNLVVRVTSSGHVDFLALYRAIREWEASSTGIVFDHILDGSGNIELPDGTRTPRCMIFVNGWRLSADSPISILGGYVAGQDEQGNPRHPVVDEARDRVNLMLEGAEDSLFVPSEAQIRHALFEAARFREDWEVDPDNYEIRRGVGASDRKHSVFGLYWFVKEEWLSRQLVGLGGPPVLGDNLPPVEGTSRRYQLDDTWKIPHADLLSLTGGPLLHKGSIVVPEDAPGPLAQQPTHPSQLRDRDAVTIGVVTALPKEYEAVRVQLDDVREYRGQNSPGRQVNFHIGTAPGFAGRLHTVAVMNCGVGNNSAAVRAVMLANEFPNVTSIIMVGIAGAVPNPTKAEDHVRLGDIVVSGEQGVVQYDYVKQNNGWQEPRHRPRPPDPQLLDAVGRLLAGETAGRRPWLGHLSRASSLEKSSRPGPETDRLAKAPTTAMKVVSRLVKQAPSSVGALLETAGAKLQFLARWISHPPDPDRRDSEPRIFLGTIGAANKLLKDPVLRDRLRELYGVKAVEMESSGIADASWDLQIGYVVIRGTCDYCDGEKNDTWQEYAAVVAGAYMRALLEAA